jgi:hypothetical protein
MQKTRVMMMINNDGDDDGYDDNVLTTFWISILPQEWTKKDK